MFLRDTGVMNSDLHSSSSNWSLGVRLAAIEKHSENMSLLLPSHSGFIYGGNHELAPGTLTFLRFVFRFSHRSKKCVVSVYR